MNRSRILILAAAWLLVASVATVNAQSESASPVPSVPSVPSVAPSGSSGPSKSSGPGGTIGPGESGEPLASPGAPATLEGLTVTLEPFASIPQSATFMGSPLDGSGTLYALQQLGRIWKIAADGTVDETPYLDLTDEVLAGGERGLLGLAFHPNFSSDPRVYVDYTRKEDGATVVAEFAVHDGKPDPATERQVLLIPQPFPNHNGGMLAFGPDDDLYVAMGDGGSADDPSGNGQNTHQLLGKLLRIDVDGTAPYGIPPGNPSTRGKDVVPEIWDWGLRNPWRFSFDRRTGWLWIGDVGQDTTEEIDLESPTAGGIDYGWNVMEGTHCFHPATGCDQTGLKLPLLDYAHEDNRCAVIGGYVDHSTTYPALDGVYFYGDYCSHEIWALDANSAETGQPVAPTLVATNGWTITAFAQDEKGDVYVVGADGEISLLTGGYSR